MRILGQQQNLQILLDLRQFRLQPKNLQPRHFPQVGIGLGQHRLRLLELSGVLFILAVLGDDFGQIAVRLRHLAVLVAIADHGCIRHLRGQFFEMLLDLIEFLAVLHSGDNQFAALRRFERHGAFERGYRHFSLLVGWRLCRDALRPEAGSGQQTPGRSRGVWRRNGSVHSSGRSEQAA